MNIRTPLIRATLATALVGGVFALSQAPRADAALDQVSMSVEAIAPLHAMLLPTVTIVAAVSDPDAEPTMHVAAGHAVPVTLLPTVHVFAHEGTLTQTSAAPADDVLAAVDGMCSGGALDTRLAAVDLPTWVNDESPVAYPRSTGLRIPR